MIPVPGPWQESNIIKLRGEVSNFFEVLREIVDVPKRAPVTGFWRTGLTSGRGKRINVPH